MPRGSFSYTLPLQKGLNGLSHEMDLAFVDMYG
jgi:hypothetical protein